MSIELKDVKKSFAASKVLTGINLRVDSGSIHGFLGPNGAGKTTTMNIITGLLKSNSGTVLINGIDIEKDPLACKKQIGYLPEVPPLYSEQTVLEFLRFIAQIRGVGRKDLGEAIAKVVQTCELSKVTHKLTANLSKGYKQRVGLAAALVHNPEIVILDEPTNGLDPLAITHMRELIQNLRQNHTVLLSSHLLHEVSEMCDTITLINKGQVVKSGSKEQILNSIKQETKMKVVVEKVSDQAIEEIKRLDLVKDFAVLRQEKQAELTICFKDEKDHRSEISKLLINNGAVPLEMQVHKPDLEEVYKGLIS